MKVYKIVPRGYCKGVVNAIKIAKQCKEDYPDQPISILGMIVHNQYIVEALERLNIKTIDQKGKNRMELLDLVNEGVIIITAHGTGQDVIKKAKDKGLIVVDATCKDVIKTHDLIKESLLQNEEVLYIGKKGHPESEGAISINTDLVHLIESKQDIDQFIHSSKHFMLTNQTTMSLWDVKEISDYAKEKLQHVRVLEEICHATTIRQQAMTKIPKDTDIIYVVGDPHSNNTTRLAAIGKDHTNAKVFSIQTVHDINLEDLQPNSNIAITAGASTPTYLTNQVIEYLERLDFDHPKTFEKPLIDLNKII